MIGRYYLNDLLFFVDNDVYCKLFCKLREFIKDGFYDDNFKADLFLSFIDKLFFFNKLLCDNMFFYFLLISNDELLNFSLYLSFILIVIHFVSYLLFDFFSSFLLLLFIKISLLFFLLLQLIELKSISFYF